jgi:hypothetical protein
MTDDAFIILAKQLKETAIEVERLRVALVKTRNALGYTDASISRCEEIIDTALGQKYR